MDGDLRYGLRVSAVASTERKHAMRRLGSCGMAGVVLTGIALLVLQGCGNGGGGPDPDPPVVPVPIDAELLPDVLKRDVLDSEAAKAAKRRVGRAASKSLRKRARKATKAPVPKIKVFDKIIPHIRSRSPLLR